MDDEATVYRFGPLERRGLLLGLRVGHLVLLGAGGLSVVGVVTALPNEVGVLAALVLGLGFATAGLWPIAGRTADEWAPVVARYAWAWATGRTLWVAAPERRGVALTAAVPGTAPPPLEQGPDGCRGEPDDEADDEPSQAWIRGVVSMSDGAPAPHVLLGVRLLAARWGEGDVGVLHDRARDWYTAVLAAQGGSFALLDADEQDRRLAAWGEQLADVGRESGCVVRLQWLNRTVGDDSEAVVRDFAARRAAGAPSAAVSSYLALLDVAAPSTQQHEVYLAVTIGARQAARSISRRRGRRDRDACEVLAREVDRIARRLGQGDVAVRGVLGVRMLAALLRLSVDPAARAGLDHRAAAHPDLAGAAPDAAWAQGIAEEWGCLRTDSAWHRTYWISEWPRQPVRADFLGALILGTRATRTVSVVMHVEPPGRAMRRVEAQAVDDVTTEETRRRLGFRIGQRRQQEQANVVRREQELADGHASVRFSGYITVTAPGRRELDEASADVEQAARAARLDVRVEYGTQAQAFTYTLPLGRGLR